MDKYLGELLLGKAKECAIIYYEKHTIDSSQFTINRIEKPAEIWGENILSWKYEAISKFLKQPLMIEVSIDPDGYISANIIEK